MPTGAVFANRPVTPLLSRAQHALGMTNEQFGKALGASKRTAARWAAGQSSVSVAQLHALARLVHARNPALAAEVAAAARETLESLGIVAPRPSLTPDLVADAVVCAAGDALDLPLSSVRAVVLAAFQRAGELGLSIADVTAALAAAKERSRKGAGE